MFGHGHNSQVRFKQIFFHQITRTSIERLNPNDFYQTSTSNKNLKNELLRIWCADQNLGGDLISTPIARSLQHFR